MSIFRRAGAFFGAFMLLGTVAWADSLGFSIAPTGSDTLEVLVLDDFTLSPIHDAVITQGESLVPSSIEFSDFRGMAQMPSARGRTLTVSKAGYAAISLIGVPSTQVTIYLKPLVTTIPEEIVGGRVGGWDVLASQSETELTESSPPAEITEAPATLEAAPLGKPVHLGLVLKGLSGHDLVGFSLNSVISPLYDVIDVFGPRNIPSNVSMPKQKVPVLIGSITIEKYNYRLPLPRGRAARLAIIQGVVDSSELIKLGQSGKFTADAVNKIAFGKIGLSPMITPTGPTPLDINGDLILAPTHTVDVKAPPFAADVLVAALTDLNGDREILLPTDIKAPILQEAMERGPVAPLSISLKSTSAPQGMLRGVTAVAVTRDLKRITGVVRPSAEASVMIGDFLDTSLIPDVASLPARVNFQAPATGLGLTVFESSVPIDDKRSRSFPIWYVYTFPSNGATSIQTALLPVREPVKSYAVLQMEFNPRFDERAIDGRTVISDLQRFSRTAAKIGSRTQTTYPHSP